MKHAFLGMVVVLLLGVLPVARHADGAESKQVNVNTATAADLAAVRGLGEVKAQAIVDYRAKNGPFKSVDDLVQVKGIGEKLLTKVRPQLTLEAGAPPAPAAPSSAKH
ncbi:MAG: topoisomerase [Deltaproteobacteria bacterium]|jgi:competence protein ComEA|nr:topoisomerase [Deltaproteobacteria bacterium]